MTTFILGAGGHGRDLASIAEACGRRVEFYDDDPSLGFPPVTGIRPPATDDDRYLVGLNDPATRQWLSRIARLRHMPDRLIHPAATTVDPVYGPGSVVGAGTTIGPETTLGSHAHVGAGCTLTRTTVGDYATIGPGCDIAGDVTIGEGAFLGVGVTVKNLVTIGAWARIGAGSVVVGDVADGVTVAGVPAKPLVAS